MPSSVLRFPGDDPATEIVKIPGSSIFSPLSSTTESISGVTVKRTSVDFPGSSLTRITPLREYAGVLYSDSTLVMYNCTTSSAVCFPELVTVAETDKGSRPFLLQTALDRVRSE